MQRKVAGAVAAFGVAVTMASCSGGDGRGAEQPTTTTTIPLADLEAAARATIDESTLRFRTVVATSLPGTFAGSTIRSGAYDVPGAHGHATFVVTAENVDAAFAELESGEAGMTFGEVFEQVGGQRFEYRLLDETFWQGIPQPSGLRWIGTDAETMTEVAGNALVGAVDGGVLVTALNDAVVRADRVADGLDGATIWNVELKGDAVGPLSTGSGTYGRLTDAGFDGKSRVHVDGTFAVDADGRLVRVETDLSTWWRAALEETNGERVDDLVVRAVFAFDGFGEPVVVTEPCPDPETDSSGRFPVLVCPA